MDYLEGVNPLATSSKASGNVLEYLIGVGVALVVLRMEFMRREVSLPGFGSLGNGCKLVRLYAPEATGLIACLALATHLRINNTDHAVVVDDANWAEIMRQWPILLTADTLLSLQSMLRLLVLVSSVLRMGDGPTPLSQETAAILCGAILGRVVLATRTADYMLDGPLGGYLPVACEALCVPLLVCLSRGIRCKNLAGALLTLGVVARTAHRNRLSLSGDAISDALFIFAHLAELVAAFAYLSRALFLDTGRADKVPWCVALRFAHVLMPVQACLSAYYFVQAFDFQKELVGAGHPFEVLQIGGVMQLGVYAAAAVLHSAECVDSSADDAATAHAEDMPEQLVPQLVQ